MASEDESQSVDTHHEERDWEDQKENFRICYIDNNMTRKDSAEYMKQHFNFHATPRQWERKIKQWGFSKYTGREERLAQIAQAGKTVHDVSRPGRRPRTTVDDHGNLHPHEDRNLRRFARREVSRSRSRSRSASFVDQPRPQFKSEFSEPSVPTVMNPGFDFPDMGTNLGRRLSTEGPNITRVRHSRESSEPVPPSFFQNQQTGVFGTGENASNTVNVQNQWNSTQHDLPPFNPYSHGSIPMHGSQGLHLPASNQAFPGNAAGTAFGYPMQDPSMQSVPPGFTQFQMPRANVTMQPGIRPEDIMTEQGIFENTMHISQGGDSLDQADFNIPIFDIVDMDSASMIPESDADQLTPRPHMPTSPTESSFDSGPLNTDVLPLLEQYTRAVQAIALGTVAGGVQVDMLSRKLAADLVQPSQMFMASMSIVLDNFAKTQQRSYQSIKDTCSKLRQKNALLEQMLNGGAGMEAVPSIENQSHQTSVPPQPQMYGDMFSQNY